MTSPPRLEAKGRAGQAKGAWEIGHVSQKDEIKVAELERVLMAGVGGGEGGQIGLAGHQGLEQRLSLAAAWRSTDTHVSPLCAVKNCPHPFCSDVDVQLRLASLMSSGKELRFALRANGSL